MNQQQTDLNSNHSLLHYSYAQYIQKYEEIFPLILTSLDQYYTMRADEDDSSGDGGLEAPLSMSVITEGR